VPQRDELKSPSVFTINSKLVLIGEDDLDDQELLKEVFSSIDGSFTLVFAVNGTEVLNYLDKNKSGELPCLIILDYNMPGLTGAEILKELQATSEYKSIPKIIWSTSKSTTYKDICLEMGANDCLVKPSTVNELVDICRYMLSTCTS
jgi:CheY-like chemotaxis protein